MQSINPTTDQVIATYLVMDESQVERCIQQAHLCFSEWKKTSFPERRRLMEKLAGLLEERKNELAVLAAREMGKLRSEAMAEIEKCAGACRYYAEHAESMLADRPVKTEAHKSFITFQPIGAVLAIMPWNFPFWQVFRFAVPSLMAGNVGLLKHASNTTGCALACEQLFADAGFPKRAFTTLVVPSSRMADIIAHPHIKAVTLTGSTPAGKAVAAEAGKHLKKTVLELGGSDAYVILEDADIERAANVLAGGRLLNCGQSCIAAKRMIVTPRIKSRFEDALMAEFSKRVMGDPLDSPTSLAPMSREDLRDELHAQVTATIKAGATCLLGGEIPQTAGAFYPATILTNVAKGMPAYGEELFGPVATIIPAESEEHALRIANDTSFGLGGGIFSANIERAEKLAREVMEAGCCFVNSFVRSDVRLPFGGVKESGYGRELADFGIREFVNIKSVSVTQ